MVDLHVLVESTCNVRERLYVLGNVAKAERTRNIYAAVWAFYDSVEGAMSSKMDKEDKLDVVGDAQHDFEQAVSNLI